jgi:hypothetical protein
VLGLSPPHCFRWDRHDPQHRDLDFIYFQFSSAICAQKSSTGL